MMWATRYVGIPHSELNCWALVRRVLLDERGLFVPAYGEIDAEHLMSVARAVRRESGDEIWHEVQALGARAFDVVLMRVAAAQDGGHRFPAHVGIVSGRDQILHSEPGHGAVVVRASHPSVRHRVVGFYRHRSLG